MCQNPGGPVKMQRQPRMSDSGALGQSQESAFLTIVQGPPWEPYSRPPCSTACSGCWMGWKEVWSSWCYLVYSHLLRKCPHWPFPHGVVVVRAASISEMQNQTCVRSEWMAAHTPCHHARAVLQGCRVETHPTQRCQTGQTGLSLY